MSDNNIYKQKYIKSLKYDLENLKMDVPEYDIYGHANLKEIPDINYENLINNLSKLKIDGISEKAEVIDELVNDSSNNNIFDDIKTIDENTNDLESVKIPEFNISLAKRRRSIINNNIDIDKVLDELREKNKQIKNKSNINNDWLNKIEVVENTKAKDVNVSLNKEDIIVADN